MGQVDQLRHLLQTILASAMNHLVSPVAQTRVESTGDKPDGYAILRAVRLALRAASESEKPRQACWPFTTGSGHFAMFSGKARPWNLPDLANFFGMSCDAFMRHFRDKLARSAIELLTDMEVWLPAQLKKPAMPIWAVAGSVGYQSVPAFRHVFADGTR